MAALEHGRRRLGAASHGTSSRVHAIAGPLSIGTTNGSVCNSTHQFAGLGNNVFRGFSTFFIVRELSSCLGAHGPHHIINLMREGQEWPRRTNLENTGDNCVSEPFMGLRVGKVYVSIAGHLSTE